MKPVSVAPLRRIATCVSAAAILTALPAGPASASTVFIPAGANIQDAIDGHRAGTTFQLAAGTWILTSTLVPKSGDSFLGAGMGQTILDGVNRTFNGFAGTSETNVEIAYLTVQGFSFGVRTGSDWALHDMEMTANQIGVRMNGDGPIVRNSSIHHNTQFGVLGTTSNGRFLSNDVSYNRTDQTFDPGSSGATKWVNSTGLLVEGNDVHDNYGKGLWLDIEDHGCTFANNVVRDNLDEGIRVEIGYDSLVEGNQVDGNGGGGINVLNSSGTVVRGNTISAPASAPYALRFTGNGRTSGGVEYTNTNNRAESNTITLTSGQSVGVVRTAGTTNGNSFDSNDYRVSSLTDRYFKWWDGAKQWTVSWSDWQGFGQDLSGSITSSGLAPIITSFTPSSGSAGTAVTITGQSFTGATAVAFSGVSSSRYTIDSDTQITATVPRGTTTGPISVTGPGGTATSSTNFKVIPRIHRRSVSLRLRAALIASGYVRVPDGFAACRRHVPVNIQRRISGVWRGVATRWTDAGGFFQARLRDISGWYRAVVPKRTLSGDDVCGGDVSRRRYHG